NLSMSLGTSSLTPLSIARGYTVFGNGGYLVEPWFVEKVVDRHGSVVFQADPARVCRGCPGRPAEARDERPTLVDGFDFSDTGPAPATDGGARGEAAPDGPVGLAPRAIDERTAWLVRSMLLDVVARGTGAQARALGRPDVGGKSGSTNDYRDA